MRAECGRFGSTGALPSENFNHRGHRGTQGKAPQRMGRRIGPSAAGYTNYLYSWAPKLNRSLRSPIAGLFNGTYGLLLLVMGLGKLSRLRAVRGASPQLASMNFRIEG